MAVSVWGAKIPYRTVSLFISYSNTIIEQENFTDYAIGLEWWLIKYRSISSGLSAQIDGFNSSLHFTPAMQLNVRYSFPIHKRFSIDLSPSVAARLYDEKIYPQAGFSMGGRYFFSPKWQLGLRGYYKSILDETDHYSTGLEFLIEFCPGFRDNDGDWIHNGVDVCANTPKNAVVDDKGCGIDSDADGVFDGLDKCPHTPLAALVDSTGCPTDSDGDGVFDGVDRCYDTPADIPVDETGCPRDTDDDGVPDYMDSCENTPESAVVDKNGCAIDSDEDGIPDGLDQCQNTPTGFQVDRFGCPTIPTADGVVVYDLFDDNLKLTANAMNMLYRAAKRIRAYPDRITKISIYTDTEGSPTYNRNRARSVGKKLIEFLEEEGVSAELVEIVPMGEKDPVIPGSSKEAKQKNRRAVFAVEE